MPQITTVVCRVLVALAAVALAIYAISVAFVFLSIEGGWFFLCSQAAALVVFLFLCRYWGRGCKHMTREERYLLSRRINAAKRQIPVDYWEFRNRFRSMKFTKYTGQHYNPHRECANWRKTGDNFINELTALLGKQVYSESSSRRDASADIRGSRLYYDFKDLTMEPALEEVTEDHIVKMVDVDYYVEQEEIDRLINKSSGLLIYTSQPNRVAMFGDKHEYTLFGEEFTEKFAGGDPYQHKVWNWEMDTYVSVHRTKILWYEEVSITVCQIERRKCGGKTLVAVIPQVRMVSSDGMLDLALETLRGRTFLQRLSSTDMGDDIYTMSSDKVSIAQKGARTVYEMTERDFRDCLAGARTKNVNLAVLERVAGERNMYDLRALLLSMERRRDLVHVSVAPGDEPRSYAPVLENRDPEVARVPGSVICPPIIDSAFTPAEGPSSDACVVDMRVEAVRPVEKIPGRFDDYSAEFEDFLTSKGKGQKLTPYHMSDLIEKQTGRKREAYVQGADSMYVDLLWKSFQKAEAYNEVKDPRNISNVDKIHVVRYLCFTMVLSAFLKENTKWYAFGKSPSDTAQALHEMCSDKLCLTETDYSRYDGTIGRWLREQEFKFMRALFSDDVDELERLFEDTLYQDIKTKYGEWYNNGTGRLSGSACTSSGNTLINALANYIALREQGMTPQQAWDGLGFYGGDDGVTYYPNPAKAEETMSLLGLKFKSTVRAPGERVGFLGRFYMDPWTHNRSHHDIQRAANKIHYSSSSLGNATREEMLWRKAVSIYVTDSATPIIGDWAKAILRIIPNGKYEQTWLNTAHAVEIEDGKTTSQAIIDRFPEPIFPGPLPEEHEDIIRDFVDDSPIDLDDVKAWVAKVKKAKKLKDMPQEPLWVVTPDVKLTYPVVVDDAVVGPKSKASPPRICHAWEAGKCKRGSRCKFEHPPEKENTAPKCRDYLRGECKRERCQYLHPVLCDDKACRGKCGKEHKLAARPAKQGPNPEGGSRTQRESKKDRSPTG